MKVTRGCIALAAAVLVVTAGNADAKGPKPKPKPKPPAPCHLVADPAGDANGINPGTSMFSAHAGPSDGTLDIRAVDLGVGPKMMVWLLQLEDLTLASTTEHAPGMFWSIHFTIRKTTFTAVTHAGPQGVRSELTYTSPAGSGQLAPVAAVIDEKYKVIRFTVPTSAIAKQEPAPLTTTISEIGATTGNEAGGVAYNTVDWTTTDGTVVPGKPGRCAT